MTRKLKIHNSFFPWAVCLLVLLPCGNSRLFAQAEDEPVDDSLKTARISLQYFMVDGAQKLVAEVKSKIDDTYKNIPGVSVKFYKYAAEKEDLLGDIKTNEKGKATYLLTKNDLPDTAVWLSFVATIEGNPEFMDAEAEIAVKKSSLEVTLEEEDSVKWVRISITSPDENGEMVPVGEVESRVFVGRLFGLLPIMEAPEVTDEEGLLSVEFPSDIPGGGDGSLTVVAKVEDNETFGNIEVSKSVNWGVPVKPDNKYQSRELWSARSNAPLSLIFVVNIVLFGVWGVLAYIIIQIFQISKMGKYQEIAEGE